VCTGNAEISSFDDGRCGIVGHLSRVHGDIADSSAENDGTVGNTVGRFSDGITDMHLPPSRVMCNRNDAELMLQEPAVPSVTVANNTVGSVASLMQMPYMTGQLVTRANAPHGGVQICVFSTELANCAAESVRIGHCDSIIGFHQDYFAVPVSQVYTVTLLSTCPVLHKFPHLLSH